MIRTDAQGHRYSDAYCLRCDNPPPHYPSPWGGTTFQCDLCKAPIGDTEPQNAPSTWLPGRSHD